jgi:hypothetical protein
MRLARLQGVTLGLIRTGETMLDNEGERWEKCILTVEVRGFSKYAHSPPLPESVKGKLVKIVRWCCFDWHYKTGGRNTLTEEETKSVLDGIPSSGVWW